MNLSRRKFLAAAPVFVAAPAIIRVANLMPIKIVQAESLIIGSVGNKNGLLTIQMITKEAVRLWLDSNSIVKAMNGHYETMAEIFERQSSQAYVQARVWKS